MSLRRCRDSTPTPPARLHTGSGPQGSRAQGGGGPSFQADSTILIIGLGDCVIWGRNVPLSGLRAGFESQPNAVGPCATMPRLQVSLS